MTLLCAQMGPHDRPEQVQTSDAANKCLIFAHLRPFSKVWLGPRLLRMTLTLPLKKGGLSTVLRRDSSTYDHTIWKTRDPVRSPLVKPDRAGLVVGSVTTSESPVLYVLTFLSFSSPFPFIRLGSIGTLHQGVLGRI